MTAHPEAAATGRSTTRRREPQRPGETMRPAEAYVSLYTDLSRKVQAEGLLRRRYGYYWTSFVLAFVAFVGVWAGVILLGDSGSSSSWQRRWR